MSYLQRLLLVAALTNVLQLGNCKHGGSFRNMKALTFNTGLSGVVERKNPGHETSREDRRTAIIDAIRFEDADIVCLQEVMLGKDIEAIITGLLNIYPSSHSSLHLFNGALPSQSATPVVPPCPNEQTTALLACVIAKECLKLLGGATDNVSVFLDCVSTSCLADFEKVALIGGEKCMTCIQNQINDHSNIVSNCAPLTPTSPLGTMNTNGLLMLSKRNFTSRRTVDFYPNSIELLVLGYLEAKIEDEFTTVCTHLAPRVSGSNPEPVMRGFFKTSIKQNAYEIGQLISQFRDVEPAVLMGDFNVNGRSTPAGSGQVSSEMTELFHNTIVSGSITDQFRRLISVFNTDVSKECSSCPSPVNVYNVNEGSSEEVIDFVFGNGFQILNTKRVFTPDRESWTIKDKGQGVPLSDHFGITGEFNDFTSGRTTYG